MKFIFFEYRSPFALICYITFLSFLLSGCERTEAELESSGNRCNDIVSICIKLEKNEAEANGITTIKVTAFIPKNADEANKTITFSTNTGSFALESNKNTPQIRANSNGEAITYLTVGSTPGIFTVNASITVANQTFSVEDTLKLNPPIASSLVLRLSDTIVPADGKTQITLEAMLPPAFFINQNTIKFVVGEAGNFIVPSDPSKPNETEVLIDPNGKSVAKLKIRAKPGSYTIKAFLTSNPVFSDQRDLVLSPLPSTEVIKMKFNNDNLSIDTLTANNSTIFLAVAQIDKIDYQNKKVAFEISGGWNFLDQTGSRTEIPINSDGQAAIFIKVGQTPILSILKASIDDYSIFVSPILKPANPFNLFLVPIVDSIKTKNGQAVVNAHLLRPPGYGQVSLGTNIESYQILQGSTELLAQDISITNIGTSDSNGIIRLELRTFSTSNISVAEGNLRLVVSVYDANNSLISSSPVLLKLYD